MVSLLFMILSPLGLNQKKINKVIYFKLLFYKENTFYITQLDLHEGSRLLKAENTVFQQDSEPSQLRNFMHVVLNVRLGKLQHLILDCTDTRDPCSAILNL